jgi:Pyruvate/2-oxoacid:ferredoxin oxidoreductase gamma subunit
VKSRSPSGVLIYDSSLIQATTERAGIRVVGIPVGDIVSSREGATAENLATMGAFIAATGIVGVNSALRALDEVTPVLRRNLLDVNKDTIMKGYGSLQATPPALLNNGR